MHKEKRKTALQAFTPEALEDYTKHLQEIIGKVVKKWPEQDQVKVYDAMEELAFEAASEIIIGIPVDLIDTKKFASDFNIWLEGFFVLPLNLPGTAFNKV